ncbi:hypothetical protein F4780DRAFT_478768 [Xylariomycetidae sp. FL0641]|nr:hypothetical protein F4780DRAFT_478768 [Xylariomycetidae sp. FL0641]
MLVYLSDDCSSTDSLQRHDSFTMATSSSFALGLVYQEQVRENCEFFIGKDDFVSVIVSKDVVGKFKAYAIRHGDGTREPIVASEALDSAQESLESLLSKSCEAVHQYISTNGFALPPDLKASTLDSEFDDEEGRSVGYDGSSAASSTAALSEWDSSEDEDASPNKRASPSGKKKKKSSTTGLTMNNHPMNGPRRRPQLAPIYIGTKDDERDDLPPGGYRPPPPQRWASPVPPGMRAVPGYFNPNAPMPPPGMPVVSPPCPPSGPMPPAARPPPNTSRVSYPPNGPNMPSPPGGHRPPMPPLHPMLTPYFGGVMPNRNAGTNTTPATSNNHNNGAGTPQPTTTTTAAPAPTPAPAAPAANNKNRLYDVRLTLVNHEARTEARVLDCVRPSLRALETAAIAYAVNQSPATLVPDLLEAGAAALPHLRARAVQAFFGPDDAYDLAPYRGVDGDGDLGRLFNAMAASGGIPRFVVEVQATRKPKRGKKGTAADE